MTFLKKNPVISVLIIIIIILGFIVYLLGVNFSKTIKNLKKEESLRIQAEEKVEQLKADNEKLKEKVITLQEEKAFLQRELKKTQDGLKKMEEEYQRLKALKIKLEENLKDALMKLKKK